jgi:hypothetical protein
MHEEVKGTYGANGNVSVPPAVILKMMIEKSTGFPAGSRQRMIHKESH